MVSSDIPPFIPSNNPSSDLLGSKMNTETSSMSSHDSKTDPAVTATQPPQNAANSDPEQVSSSAENAEDANYPHGLKLAVILGALCLSIFLVALDNTIISTAIPRITDHFHSIKDIGWYGSSYLLTATALQPTFGRVYTIFNVRISCTPVT